MSDVEKGFYLESCDKYIEDVEQSRIMERLMLLHPHASLTYTYDDIGTASLISDLYSNNIRYCPQDGDWYIWDGSRWERQKEIGMISDNIQTVFNLLLFYCKEIAHTNGEDSVKEYKKYCQSIRKNTAIKNIMEILKTMVRLSAENFDSDPYLLNTPVCAYNLRNMEIVENREERNITQVTSCNMDSVATPCNRWYQFIDEVMSHNKEKAAFLQRALGYSLLGVNREECMFIAYGSNTRNGKGTLFSSIQNVLGKEYSGGSDPALICETKNGKSVDFNSPQPALRKLIGTRLVNMSEADRSAILDAAAVKAMTGRDVLTTRGLYEGSFDFVPQYTMWLNTNYLPAITDDTVFRSNRIWVITFDEYFGDKATIDTNLKELFKEPTNQPTILKWLIDGCQDYFRQGLNPPKCVKTATEEYHSKCDRIGNFIKECCTIDPDSKVLRGKVASAYRSWCCKSENSFKPLGSTTFYNEMEIRGYPSYKTEGEYYISGLIVGDISSGVISLR